jgi:hypothetical protein
MGERLDADRSGGWERGYRRAIVDSTVVCVQGQVHPGQKSQSKNTGGPVFHSSTVRKVAGRFQWISFFSAKFIRFPFLM